MLHHYFISDFKMKLVLFCTLVTVALITDVEVVAGEIRPVKEAACGYFCVKLLKTENEARKNCEERCVNFFIKFLQVQTSRPAKKSDDLMEQERRRDEFMEQKRLMEMIWG